MKFPILMISKKNGMIVEFTGIRDGKYTEDNVNDSFRGEIHNNFIPCTNTEHWSEYVTKDVEPIENESIRGNGDSTSYYDLPEGATILNDLIKHKRMEHGIGEAFCALYRLNDNGEYKRNLTKVKFYIEEELKWLEKNV